MSFESQLNFRMANNANVNGLDIVNVAPKKGEEKLYTYRDDDIPQRGYGLITLVSNLSGDGHVLIIQGTTTSGDGMATEFLENGKELVPMLNEASGRSGLRNFEILLASPFAGTSWSSWTVFAHRVHWPGDNLAGSDRIRSCGVLRHSRFAFCSRATIGRIRSFPRLWPNDKVGLLCSTRWQGTAKA
jgi:hypothetical protein